MVIVSKDDSEAVRGERKNKTYFGFPSGLFPPSFDVLFGPSTELHLTSGQRPPSTSVRAMLTILC